MNSQFISPAALQSGPAILQWGLAASPFGAAGVICDASGLLKRVVLPCDSESEALGNIAKAYAGLLAFPGRRRKRIEEIANAEDPPQKNLPPAPGGSAVAAAVQQLIEYFAGARRSFDLECDWSAAGGFTRQALEAAAQIPYGQTRSYWWVAVRAGNPRAVRAVGQAMAANPFPLVFPCHRVVRADGSLGGFGGGGPRLKQQLIELERKLLSC